MANDKSGIEWCDATWSPIRGCSRVSEGCRNCYAEKQAARIIAMDRGRGIPEGEGSYDGLLASGGQWNGKIKLVKALLDWPMRKKKPMRIFVNSMSDLFHENVPFEFVEKVHDSIRQAPQHTFQILTKRPARMLEYWRWRQEIYLGVNTISLPPKNAWYGVSVEDQATADERIPLLLQTPAAVRWISAEPLLGAIDLTGEYLAMKCGGRYPFPMLERKHRTQIIHMLDWVVVGGESGKEARPMQREWARSLRDQCQAAGVPFLFKQWGEWAPNWLNDDDGHEIPDSMWMDRQGKRIAGRTLDGRIHDDYPPTHKSEAL